MDIRITEKDLVIIRWINSYGFVGIDHVAKKFNLNKDTVYKRLRKLVLGKYLEYERIFHGRNGIYRVTNKGVKISQDDLSALRKVNLAKYEHDLIVVTVSLQLLTRHTDAEFITERRLRHIKSIGVGSRGHICDGILAFENKQIALEIELSSKGSKRRESIIKFYTREFQYDEVWYVCGSEFVKNQLIPLVKSRPFIKLLDLKKYQELHE